MRYASNISSKPACNFRHHFFPISCPICIINRSFRGSMIFRDTIFYFTCLCIVLPWWHFSSCFPPPTTPHTPPHPHPHLFILPHGLEHIMKENMLLLKYLLEPYISKNVSIDKLDDIVNKYNNTYHSTIKIKPADV